MILAILFDRKKDQAEKTSHALNLFLLKSKRGVYWTLVQYEMGVSCCPRPRIDFLLPSSFILYYITLIVDVGCSRGRRFQATPPILDTMQFQTISVVESGALVRTPNSSQSKEPG
jgi:hypothetical protein